MQILVDGYNLMRPEGTGVATYARGFIRAAQSLGNEVGILMGLERQRKELMQSSAHDLYAHRGVVPIVWRLRRIAGSALSPLGYNAYSIGAPPSANGDDRLPEGTTIWNSYGLFAHAIGAFRQLNVFSTVRVEGVQIAHWTYPLPLRVENAINIYTLHDLVPLIHPELTLDDRLQYKRLCHAVAERADHLLTVSESSKRDIVEHLGVQPERITNTFQGHGINEADLRRAEAQADKVAREFDLAPGEYFVFAGAIEPKKNLARLLTAYLESGSTTPLALIGTKGWEVERQLQPLLEHTSSKRENVRLLGYQPRSKLLALMRGAKATFFPSLAEGFGLPAVESMALETPVLASHAGGLAEVVGDAAALVDPLSISEIMEAIRRLDSDEQFRLALAEAGRKRAERFSMGAYTARLQDLFAQLTSEPRPR